MNCPNCGVKLRPVQARSHYGKTMVLDQCPNCGGIWSDPFEFYQIKTGEAGKIDPLDVDLLRQAAHVKAVMHCPRDSTLLKKFSDPNFPQAIIIETCPLCRGLWFNRGELAAYHRSKVKPKPDTRLDPKLAEQIDKILKLYGRSPMRDFVRRLGQALSTPIDRTTFQPLDESTQDPEVTRWVSTVGSITNLLLRLLVRR